MLNISPVFTQFPFTLHLNDNLRECLHEQIRLGILVSSLPAPLTMYVASSIRKKKLCLLSQQASFTVSLYLITTFLSFLSDTFTSHDNHKIPK